MFGDDLMLIVDCFSFLFLCSDVVDFIDSIYVQLFQGDKNSIVQSAAQYVRELKGVQKALQKRNEELKAEILRNNATDGAKIKISVTNPSSSIDSMIGALRCLKSLDVKAKAIRSDLSSAEFSATMSIDTKVRNILSVLVQSLLILITKLQYPVLLIERK